MGTVFLLLYFGTNTFEVWNPLLFNPTIHQMPAIDFYHQSVSMTSNVLLYVTIQLLLVQRFTSLFTLSEQTTLYSQHTTVM